jgi:hypothetical protein
VGSLAGALSGDSVSNRGIQIFTDKNFGIGNKTVTASGLAIRDISGADMTGNYNPTYISNTTSTINQATLIATANQVTKTYDGTTNASGRASIGSFASTSDTVLSYGFQTFLDKNIGLNNKTVIANGLRIKDIATGVETTTNYSIIYRDNTSSTINPAILMLLTIIEISCSNLLDFKRTENVVL